MGEVAPVSPSEDNGEGFNSPLGTFLTFGDGSGWRTTYDISWISMDLIRTRLLNKIRSDLFNCLERCSDGCSFTGSLKCCIG